MSQEQTSEETPKKGDHDSAEGIGKKRWEKPVVLHLEPASAEAPIFPGGNEVDFGNPSS